MRFPSHDQEYRITNAYSTGSGVGVGDNDNYYVSVEFEYSASGIGSPHISNYPYLPSHSMQYGQNAMFNFITHPTPVNEPEGGYTVGDLLNVLSTYGQTGVPVGSLGDINLDGSVNVSDLLLVLSGYGNPNQICQDVVVPVNVNHQLIGPDISICEGHYLIIPTGSVCSITL